MPNIFPVPMSDGSNAGSGVSGGDTPPGGTNTGLLTFDTTVTMKAGRQITFDIDDPAAAVITQQPSNGVARLRADGRMQVDLTEARVTAAQSVAFTANGAPYTVNVSVINNAEADSGWGKGLHYYPEIDNNDAIVVEPRGDSRIIHIAQNGNNRAAIAAAAGVSQSAVTNAWLSSRPQYHSESFPLNENVGNDFANYLLKRGGHCHVLYNRGDTFSLPAGNDPVAGFDRFISATPLHPILIGAYGTGARPVFTSSTQYEILRYSRNIVFQSLHFQGSIRAGSSGNLVFDDLKSTSESRSGGTDYPMQIEGGVRTQDRITIRRLQMYDASFDTPKYGNWLNSDDRLSGIYVEGNTAVMMEKVVMDMIGWDEGYGTGAQRDLGKIPDDRSHAIYDQSENNDMTKRDMLLLRACHSAIQLRSGGIVERMFTAGCNTGINPGKGWRFANGENAANWNYVADYVQTYPGQKQLWNNRLLVTKSSVSKAPVPGEVLTGQTSGARATCDRFTDGVRGANGVLWLREDGSGARFQSDERVTGDQGADFQSAENKTIGEPDLGVTAGGILAAGIDTVLNRVIFAHYPNGTPVTRADQTGPIGNETRASGCFTINNNNGGSFYLEEYKQYNVKPAINANRNVDGLSGGALDAATVGAFVNAQWSLTGTTAKSWYPQLQDLATQIRGEDQPWTVLPNLLAHFQTPFGYGQPARTTPQTVAFLPRADGASPGIRADIRDDWSTADLPGTVAGDSVDISNYAVIWNITPANPISTLRFGPGGALRATGGAIKPAAAINTATGGNIMTAENGAKVQLPGFSDSDKLTLVATEARVSNTGAVTGLVDVEAMGDSEVLFGLGEGHSWSVGRGTITLHGAARAGFDGQNGAAMTLNFSADSTLNLKAAAVMTIGNLVETDINLTRNGRHEYFPKVGTILTGNSSGATGRVASVVYVPGVSFRTVLTDVSGSFAAGETVRGARTYSGLKDASAGPVGQVDGAPVFTLPRIQEFTSGIYGTAAPDVTTNITLGGTLNIDVTGMAPGSYDLISADTLTGAFDAVNITGGSGSVAVVENPLRVTVL